MRGDARVCCVSIERSMEPLASDKTAGPDPGIGIGSRGGLALLSCFVDDEPRFHAQAMRWIASAAACRTAATDLVIHHASELPRPLKQRAEVEDVRLVRVERFGDGPAAYCNKLQQFDALLSSGHPYVILSDVDLWFLSDPAELCVPDRVRARVVDKQNPPEDVLISLLRSAGFEGEHADVAPMFEPESRTHRFNCNGGLYLLPRASLQRLAAPWRSWSSYCLSRADLLGSYLLHSDQLGFMLAVLESGIEIAPLPAGANLPTHLPASDYPATPVHALSLHYHDRIDESGHLCATGCEWLDRVLAQVNGSLRGSVASLSGAMVP